jgi:hypothetical protein
MEWIEGMDMKPPLFRAIKTPVVVSYWLARWPCESSAGSFCPTASQWELRSTLHFPPASYVIRNFRPADYWACHLLSRWYSAWLIPPWRWRGYVSPKRRFTFNRLHGVISQNIVLFLYSCMQLIDTPCHKPEGRGFETRWGGFFNLPNPTSRTVFLESTQPLTEMSTRNLPVGKGGRRIELTNLPPSVSQLFRHNVGACKSLNPMALRELLQG